MPDLRQALKDFVATSNSGKYADEATLLSKFPELKGYDIQVLRDFVATSNSGKYATEDEVFAKFPEFSQGAPSKKKVDTALPSADGSLVLPKIEPQRAIQDATYVKPRLTSAPPKGKEKAGYLKTLYDNLALGASYVNEAVVSLPESVINVLAIPQNYIAEKTGWNIGTNADQVKKQLGIKNPLLDWVQESKKVLKGEVAKDVSERYNDPGIISNFQKGNYQEGFELLGASITNSVPMSLAMMYGGAYAAPELLASVTTLGLTESQRKELEEMDPTMKESEKTMKALGMAAAESVFESLGSATIGRVYRDIAEKEGKEAAKGILKDGLVKTYKKALEKTGPLAGFAGEGIEEAATQITQNVISGRPTFEGAADAFATGAGSGVVFTAPISAINAKKYIDNKIETYSTKDKIGTILQDKADNIDKLYNVPVSSKVTTEQVEIANLPKSRDILVTNLKKAVSANSITEDDAKQSLFVFDKIQQVSNSVKDLNVSAEEKADIATLLKERDALKTQIQNKDDVLVVEQKQQIENINNQIQDIILKSKGNAIQEQATDESVLRTEQPEMGLQQVVEGDQGRQVATTGTEETITPEGTQEVVSSKTRVNVAPFFNTRIETVQEAEQLRQAPAYQEYKQRLGDLATQLGLTGMKVDDVIGGFKNEQGDDFVEISNQITFDNATLDQAEEFAAMAATIAPEVQEASIAAKYVNEGDDTHNANEYRFKVDNVDGAMKALKQAGISNFSINETDGVVTFTDVFDFADEQLQEKMGRFAELLDENNINYEQQQYKPTESRYVDKGKRKEIIRRIKSQRTGPQQRGEGIGATIEQSIQRDAEFQGTTPEEYAGVEPKKPTSGNRLFNEPLKAVSEIADRYYKRVFKKVRPEYKGTRKFDEANAKRIADAFKAMKNNPNNPKVKAAYAALAKETIDQYKAFLDAGYVVEINNEEPYANSQEMIDDLRNNKRIKIFSTESGFGEKAITDKQRRENPLLATTEFKDVNDQPMLVNDLFRAIHDFFGHAELGNSFGPKGEENAWNVHARMFSPEARKAMTTETRGQNSYVNFSGVNDRIEALRDEARKLRSEGKEQEAQDVVQKIYEEMSFADQKIGLLPEEFYAIDVNDKGDVVAEEVAAPVEEEVVVEEEEVFEPITIADVKTPAFTRDNALFYEEDERETDSGRTSTYLSSVTIEATNPDGDPIGTITKITDEDKIFYFTAEDVDGSELNLDGYETLGDAKKAIADSYNKIQKKEFDKAAKKKAKDKAKAEAKKAKAKVSEPVAVAEVEEIAGVLDELLDLDVKEKDNLDKVYDALDTLDKNINKKLLGNANDATLAIPLGTVQVIVKALKALVKGGMTLRDAIKKVSKDSNISQELIKNIISIAPIQDDFNALMVKADELIARQKRRGIADAKIVSNLDTFIRNSDIYKNADDAQKKIMEREARTKMGAGPKRAVSIGRVLGSLKDITNISREEKMLVIKRIRDLSRDAAKDLAKEIREMASTGKITAVQAANIVSRFGKVNMLNEVSVSNFVDYMAKVFANAEYANKIDVAKSKLKAAKKNIVTKIGIADGLVGPLQRLFSINPTLIPDQYLERYLELVDMFGARQAVLNLEEKSVVTKDVNDILDEIDAEQSKADELADKFNYSDNKVFKDDKLDYAASIKKMLDEKEIDEKQADVMRKYKEDIAPQVEETELTEAEAEQEKNELVSVVKKSRIDGSELPSKDERDKSKQLAKLINTDAVNGLTNTELKNLLKVIDNINNNYFPHYAELMIEKLNAKNKAVGYENAVVKGKIAKFSKLYSNAKAVVAMQGRTGISEMIRRNPLFYIDQLFGNFKTKEIFDSIFEDSAKAAAIFKTELSRVQNVLENAEQKVAKSFKLDSNKTTMSKFKMMTYMVQLEYDSNKGNKQVNTAADYLKATIKHIDAGKSQFGERDAEMLQDILDTYADADGNIDNEKLYKSFNQAEKDAINDIRGINESLREKAEFTAAIIRGDRINPLNNYVHLNVLHEYQPNDLTTGSAFVTEYNNSLRPSTKAKSLIARTGKVSPLNFNVFSSAERGAKFVLMDYNLTEPIRTARKTINEATKNLEEKGRIPKEQRQILNAVNNAFEESVEGLLTNSFTQDSLLDMASDYLSKQGYRAVLAGTSRFVSELSSNIGFAVISDPKAMETAFKDRGVIMSADAPVIMENLKSKQTSRIFPTDALSGRLVDASILSQASGIKGGKAKNIVANKIQQIYNLSGKKFVNTVELIADTLISTPDKATMRPMWFGSFANEFKTITGKDVDFDKIAANDETYMADNKEALDKATKKADERSVMIGATDNPFMGILKGTIKPEQKPLLRAFNNFNNFMTKFLIFEYVTARTAVNAALGNGSLTKKQGAAVLAAVTTRMVVYGLLIQMMGNGLMGLFFDDDEPETEKSFLQKLGQAFASAFSSLLIGRDFGNAVKSILNYGVEEANEEFLDFLREGEYDPYKDGIANTLIPRDDSRDTDLGKLLMNAGGAYTPALNTAAFIYKKATEKPKKKEDAIARREKELNVRLPLEVLGNLGLVPLYKDVRKAVMKDIYKDLEKAEKTSGDKKKAKAEKLQGYENSEDMKRYDPELWNKTFGPDAPDYDEQQAKRALKKSADSLERAMKDEMYQYTPKPKKSKGGFGSEGFGGETKKKSKDGFGSDKFGQ